VALSQSAAAGLHAAEANGVVGRIVRSRAAGGDKAALEDCVRGGADVTIALGYLMVAPLNAVAVAHPSRSFVIVDANVTALPSRPQNVVGALFRSEQAGYLVGYAAGLWAKAHDAKAVGSVGGLKIPPVDSYIAGYEWGATKAYPKIETLHTYAQNVVNPAKCRAAALSQIAKGAVVELEVAGACGTGVVDAAQEKDVMAIGSDYDASALGPSVMTSALKRVDVAVTRMILAARSGTARLGQNVYFGAANGGIGYGPWSRRVPPGIRTAVARQLQLLVAGKVGRIPATVD